MLIRLRIRDFAILEDLELDLHGGLCLLTGETGAGKSILVGALGLLTGGRADTEDIRSGADLAVLEAVFSLSEEDGGARGWLSSNGLSQEREIILRRTVSRSGRGGATVNGSMVTLGQLRELGSNLVQIHGQHQGQGLLSEEEHRRLLDSLPETAPSAALVLEAHAALAAALQRLRLLERDRSGREERLEALKRRLEDIARVDPRPAEDAELRQARLRLLHAERIVQAAAGVAGLLSVENASAGRSLAEAAKIARDLAEFLPEWEALAGELSQASSVVANIGSLAEQVSNTVAFDPSALERTEGRLDDIERLKRRYGPELDDVLKARQEAEAEMVALSGSGADPAQARAEAGRLFSGYMAASLELSGRRLAAAISLSKRVSRDLRGLALENARFEVQVAPSNPPDPIHAQPWGLDEVRFLFSANPGEPLKPLSKIASGGELSRTMLALLTATRAPFGAATLVFDEVDSGIGGKPAERVGRRLKEIASGRQVLCITHLPQIAAFADHHWRVEKGVRKGRTIVTVQGLTEDGRVEEIGRMLAGESITPTARLHARQLLSDSRAPTATKD